MFSVIYTPPLEIKPRQIPPLKATTSFCVVVVQIVVTLNTRNIITIMDVSKNVAAV